LTDIAVAAFTKQLAISGPGDYLFPSGENASGHQKTFKTAWRLRERLFPQAESACCSTLFRRSIAEYTDAKTLLVGESR